MTGSRTWDDEEVIASALHEAIVESDVETNWDVTVVHGDCPDGADRMAARLALEADCVVEPHPANWRPNGVYDRGAGFKRNQLMVDLGADVCLAFIKDGSRGATHTADAAEKAGIETRRYTA